MEKSELDNFIRNTHFTGYQKIILPTGHIIPGNDRKPLADRMFPEEFEGKTYLDVGCYYGFFLHEAVRRGASRAVGIEADPGRFRISQKFASLWEGKIEVKEGLLEEVECDEQFDFVTFLNVLHHVVDPMMVMKHLARLCKGTLVVEFRQPVDYQFLYECFHKPGEIDTKNRSLFSKILYKARLQSERLIMAQVMKRVPMIGVASVDYDRSYFFSPKSFVNAFQVHMKLFRSIKFRRSLNSGQILAFCDCRPQEK